MATMIRNFLIKIFPSKAAWSVHACSDNGAAEVGALLLAESKGYEKIVDQVRLRILSTLILLTRLTLVLKLCDEMLKIRLFLFIKNSH